MLIQTHTVINTWLWHGGLSSSWGDMLEPIISQLSQVKDGAGTWDNNVIVNFVLFISFYFGLQQKCRLPV